MLSQGKHSTEGEVEKATGISRDCVGTPYFVELLGGTSPRGPLCAFARTVTHSVRSVEGGKLTFLLTLDCVLGVLAFKVR